MEGVDGARVSCAKLACSFFFSWHEKPALGSLEVTLKD